MTLLNKEKLSIDNLKFVVNFVSCTYQTFIDTKERIND